MKGVNYKIIVLVMAISILTGCMHSTEKNFDDNIVAIQGVLNQNTHNAQQVKDGAKQLSLPASVATQMMPSSSALPGGGGTSTSVRFDVSVNNVAAKEFFSGLSQGSNTSLILAPGVTGNITLKLKQVTLIDVLNAVSDLYGYHYEKTSYGYSISPKELQTRLFMIDKLSLQRTLQTSTLVNSSGGDLAGSSSASSSGGGGGSPDSPSTVTISASQKDTFWADMQITIAALIGAKSSSQGAVDSPMVQVTEETGMIVVRAYPNDMDLVEQYLKKTQGVLGREVIIEAEILDVALSSEYSAGINWAVLGAGGITSASTATDPTGGLLSSAYQLSMSGDRNNFSYALKLISTQGKVSVLSRPRVSAINNQSAIIKVGSDDYYVTNVQSQVTTNGSSTASNTTTSTINLQAYFSGIALYVTPQITASGEVNLHIHPSISKVSETSLDVTVDNQKSVLPVAKSQIRETDTVVHAKDGQVIILGGLIQTSNSSVSSGLPFEPKYEDTIGAVTTAKENSGVKTELVILLRPLIVQDGVWQAELDDISKTAYSKKTQKEFFDNARAN